MCFANPDCDVEGRREATGRLCKECYHMAARCANCGNEWSQDASEPHPHKCPECGRH
jgi:hypothetical protein